MSTGLLLKRCFSTGNLSRQLVKTPIQVFGVEGRYATALYCAATKQQKLETVESELKAIRKLYLENATFKQFLLDPTIKRWNKREIVDEVTQKLGQSDVSKNFFETVADMGRLNKLEGIMRTFEQLMSAHRGEVVCEITSAKPLDATAAKELETALKGFVKPTEKLHITMKVDPSLIGGFVASIGGDRYVDMSVSTKLQNYRNVLQQVI